MKVFTVVFLCSIASICYAQNISIRERNVTRSYSISNFSDEGSKDVDYATNTVNIEKDEKKNTGRKLILKDEYINAPIIYLGVFRNKLEEESEELRKLKKYLRNQRSQISDPSIIKTDVDNYKNKLKEVNAYRDTIVALTKYESFRAWFPTLTGDPKKREIVFESLYSQNQDKNIYLVNNTSYQFGSGGGAFNSELISAYMKGVRLSLGSVVTTNDSEQSDTDTAGSSDEERPINETEAFKRLANGGNTYLKVEVPMLVSSGDIYTLYWNASLQGNMAIEGFSSDLENTVANGSLGSNLYASLASDQREFVFHANLSGGYYFGQEEFYDDLEVSDAFWFGQLQLGVTVVNKLRLTFNINSFSSEDNLRNGKIIFGAQLLTDFFNR